MKYTPILFSGPMVRAILEGGKTQTRRVLKPQPTDDSDLNVGFYYPTLVDPKDGDIFPGSKTFGAWNESEDWPCPYGWPGDRLWVRETWQRCENCGAVNWLEGCNRGHCSICDDSLGKWKPSIHMFREYSRIQLEIVSVSAERVQDIIEEDALAEGIELRGTTRYAGEAIDRFAELWDSINSKRGFGWVVNPVVLVLEFRRVQP